MKHRPGRRTVVLMIIVAVSTMLTGGCSDAICGSDDYPVLEVNGPGSACQKKNTEPASGYARYPAGKVPKDVDDEWDVYWRTHTLNEAGAIIELSPAVYSPSPASRSRIGGS